ncbi:hypothetical protein D9M72_302460 [compost metagenome]
MIDRQAGEVIEPALAGVAGELHVFPDQPLDEGQAQFIQLCLVRQCEALALTLEEVLDVGEQPGHGFTRRLHGEQQATVPSELPEAAGQGVAQLQLAPQPLVKGRFQETGQKQRCGLRPGAGGIDGIEQQQRRFARHLQPVPGTPALPGQHIGRGWQARQFGVHPHIAHSQALPAGLTPEAHQRVRIEHGRPLLGRCQQARQALQQLAQRQFAGRATCCASLQAWPLGKAPERRRLQQRQHIATDLVQTAGIAYELKRESARLRLEPAGHTSPGSGAQDGA